MKRALLAVAIFLIASCKAQSPTEPPPIHTGSGTLRATVVDAASHAGVPNAAVEIRRADSGAVRTLTTDAAGVAEVSLPVGAYSVRIVPPSGYVARAETLTQFTLAAGTTASMTAILSKV